VSDGGSETDLEKLRWEEWKYRHDLFYRLQFRYTAAVGIICAIPVFQAENVCKYHLSPETFSIAAGMVGAVGIFHMLSEFARVVELRLTQRIFDSHTGSELRIRHPFYSWIKRLYFDQFMWSGILLFVFFAPILSYWFWGAGCQASTWA
jgi:hypothetical protein